MKNKKRGQFYLIGALVIIIVIIGFASITNYSKTKSYTKTYDLTEELKIESANVLDYGTYNEIGINQMKNLLKEAVKSYSSTHDDLDELYFVFGNSETIVFMGYQQLVEELNLEINTNLDGESSSLILTKKKVEFYDETGPGIEQVFVEVFYDAEKSSKYNFELNPGTNFYFILSEVIGTEKYITDSDDD
ncbi:MAG: hypothetical protein ABH811_01875 [archaeon]